MLFRFICLLVVFCAATVRAQDATHLFGEAAAPKEESAASSELARPAETTPEMWFYEQEKKRMDDPRYVLRHNAQQAAAQRRQRIAARKWFGLSNMRPVANPVPSMASYSPGWAGNHWDPFRWSGITASPARVSAPPIIYAIRP